MRTNLQTKTGIKTKMATLLSFAVSISFAQQVTTLAGSGTSGSTNGSGAGASFSSPFGVAIDEGGALYIADAANNEIRKIDVITGEVSTLAGSVMAGSADGAGTSASFNAPSGITTDDNGNLYVADKLNNEIRKVVISTGEVSTIAGSTTPGSADGKIAGASFYNPCGLAYDGSGNLYVSDALNHEIRKIVITTGVVSTIAGSTTSGFSNGIGSAARFNTPIGLAIDGSGNLYIADMGNNEIRKIALASGMVTTIAGCTSWGSADGIGTLAKFNAPYGVTVDGSGNLFVADYDNNEIRKIVIASGLVSTIAGSTKSGSANGMGNGASFKGVAGIITDGNGNLYITDMGNHEIRKIATLFTEVNNIKESNSLSVYPNPAKQVIHLDFVGGSGSTPMVINIIDMSGKEVMSNKEVVLNDKTTSIDITNLTHGMYFVQVVMIDNSTQIEKFIKE
jgi:sugar lactone lactonase YvrE